MDDKYSKIENSIIRKYESEIAKQIEPYEQERLGHLRRYNITTKIIWGAFFLTVLIITYWILINGKSFSPRIILRIAIGFLVLWTMACKNIGKDFKYDLKSNIIPLICKSFPNIRWITRQSNTKQEYKNSAVVPDFENIKYEDCFIGKYKNTDFLIEEIETMVGRGRKTTAVFTGEVIQFELFNKSWKAHTILRPEEQIHIQPLKHLHYIDSFDFENDKYEIFSTADERIKNLFNPEFMKIISEIKTAYEAKKIYIAFYKGTFYLGLFTYKKLMQTGSLTKPVYTDSQFKDFAKKVVSVLKIIDYFNYNENFKRQEQ